MDRVAGMCLSDLVGAKTLSHRLPGHKVPTMTSRSTSVRASEARSRLESESNIWVATASSDGNPALGSIVVGWIDEQIVAKHRTESLAYSDGVPGAENNKFRMGRLDHVHIRVPDRALAAAWYSDNLGFEPVDVYDFWATGFEGGPLQISADGGKTMLALFEANDTHPMIAQETGVAFSVDAESFVAFARSLPGEIESPLNRRLLPTDMIDFDMCWAFDLVDPWGNLYELNCYEYDQVQEELIDSDGLTPVRYWPPDLYDRYGDSPSVT